MAFLAEVADVAEAEGHHPDLHLTNYRDVTLTLVTHAVGGLSDADQREPILRPNPAKYCMLPIQHQAVWEMYKKAEASFWTGARTYPWGCHAYRICMRMRAHAYVRACTNA